MTQYASNFSANLKSLRKKKKITQKQLAEILGFSEKTVSKWECSESVPDIDVLFDIAKVFQVSIEELFSRQKKYFLGIDGGGTRTTASVCDENGALTCEYVDANNQTVTGEYDMIPILNRFVQEHPDFSYQGAKAVIALTAYDGLFGYRTNSAAEQHFGTQVYEQEIASAKQVADKLVQDGYELACYTYENKAYGNFTTEQLTADLNGWITEGASILDNITIFAYAQNSDIAQENTLYNDERLTPLTDAGFRIFLGFSAGGNTWSVMSDSYVRQGRILLSPTNIKYHGEWFGGIFNPDTILDASRGEIPT